MRKKKKKSVPELLAYWAENPSVYVDDNNQELDHWKDKSGNWKHLWIFEKFYPYTTCVSENLWEEDTEFNFSTHHEYRALTSLIADVWFDTVERIGRYAGLCCNRDNKTAIKLRNRLTNEVVYMGWYDGNLTVSTREASHPYSYDAERDVEIPAKFGDF